MLFGSLQLVQLAVIFSLCSVGSRVLSVLDSGAEGPWFKLQPRRCRVTVLGKLFTPILQPRRCRVTVLGKLFTPILPLFTKKLIFCILFCCHILW